MIHTYSKLYLFCIHEVDFVKRLDSLSCKIQSLAEKSVFSAIIRSNSQATGWSWGCEKWCVSKRRKSSFLKSYPGGKLNNSSEKGSYERPFLKCGITAQHATCWNLEVSTSVGSSQMCMCFLLKTILKLSCGWKILQNSPVPRAYHVNTLQILIRCHRQEEAVD